MKRFLIGSAVTVVFAALSPAALASEMAAVSETRTRHRSKVRVTRCNHQP